jgi:hypothetical protein
MPLTQTELLELLHLADPTLGGTSFVQGGSQVRPR